MKKYLFLDIDGCCNHDDWYYENRVIKKNWKCGDCDPHVVELLNQLGDIDVEVVISSSWGDLADKMLYDCGLKLTIVGHTEHFHGDWIVRGNEIAKWLLDFGHNDYTYVIFDDDKDMLLEQKNNFVWIDGRHGITQDHIDKAKAILAGSDKWTTRE